jgi:hypothetical protein
VVGSYSRACETLRGRERKILRERLVHAAASVVVTVAEMGQALREIYYVGKYARKFRARHLELEYETSMTEKSRLMRVDVVEAKVISRVCRRCFRLPLVCSTHIFHFASLWMDRPLGLAARCLGVFGHHSARTHATESAGILSPPKFESAQSISTPAFASMPPHHHSHDRHPHPQQKRTGPGAPEHMRAGDCEREAWGDREREWGWREKDDEESEMWVILLRYCPLLGLAVLLCILGPICDDGGCVSAYIATARRSWPTLVILALVPRAVGGHAYDHLGHGWVCASWYSLYVARRATAVVLSTSDATPVYLRASHTTEHRTERTCFVLWASIHPAATRRVVLRWHLLLILPRSPSSAV